MLNTIRREELEKRLKEGKKQRAISINLFNFCNLILDGDTDFDLIYSSSREIYVGVRLKQELGKETSIILLNNGFKREYLILKRTKRI